MRVYVVLLTVVGVFGVPRLHSSINSSLHMLLAVYYLLFYCCMGGLWGVMVVDSGILGMNMRKGL